MSVESVVYVSVYAMRSLFYDGKRKLVPVAGLSIRSDDKGNYRIPRAESGRAQVDTRSSRHTDFTD